MSDYDSVARLVGFLALATAAAIVIIAAVAAGLVGYWIG